MALYLDEFLYRGRPAGAAEPPAYHVVLGDAVIDAFGNQSISLSGPLTPAQAESHGFTLQTIAETINSQTLATLAVVNADLATARAELGATKIALTEAGANAAKAGGDLAVATSKLETALARIAELEAQIAGDAG